MGTGDENKCPYLGGTLKQTAGGGTTNQDWWPKPIKTERTSSKFLVDKSDGRRFQLCEGI